MASKNVGLFTFNYRKQGKVHMVESVTNRSGEGVPKSDSVRHDLLLGFLEAINASRVHCPKWKLTVKHRRSGKQAKFQTPPENLGFEILPGMLDTTPVRQEVRTW